MGYCCGDCLFKSVQGPHWSNSETTGYRFILINAIIVTLVLLTACVGYGFVLVRLLKVLEDCSGLGIVLFSFAIGVGVIGWLLFFLGIGGMFNIPSLIALLLPGLAAIVYFRDKFTIELPRNIGSVGWGLLVILSTIIFLDLVEALSPPGDADSLAYHFALVKKFTATGRIDFEPRAIDGAIPLLVQMTYVPAFALGGETALTMWTFASGLASGALLFVLLRNHLDFRWSLITTLIFLTLPSVVLSAGSGQVEVRNILFVLVAAYSVDRALQTNATGYVVLAGLAAGFFAATKYLGLFFVLACGLVLMMRRGWLKRGIVYSLTIGVVGFQWYYWNWSHTGDPVFPALFEYLGKKDVGFWNQEHQANLKNYLSGEIGIPVNFVSLLIYPFLATLKSIPAFDSLRAGFGPYPLLLIPFSALGLWKYRQRIFRSRLFVYAMIAIIYYILWFLSGTSQRLRHLLPILPLVIICLSVTAQRFVEQGSGYRPLVFAITLTLFIQLSGQFLFSIKSIRYVFNSETRQEYLARTVSWFKPVDWINNHLTQQDKVLTTIRWYGYLFDVPYYWAHRQTQSQINLLPGSNNLEHFVQQTNSMAITHIMPWPIPVDRQFSEKESEKDLYNSYIFRLRKANCLLPVKSFVVRRFASRTLASSSYGLARTTLYKLNSIKCNISALGNQK